MIIESPLALFLDGQPSDKSETELREHAKVLVPTVRFCDTGGAELLSPIAVVVLYSRDPDMIA